MYLNIMVVIIISNMFEIKGNKSLRVILPPLERPKSQQAPRPKKVITYEPPRPTTAIDHLKMLRKLQRLTRKASASPHKKADVLGPWDP